jgi:16S rRNA (uracil1498-N3)-methyltransferase
VERTDRATVATFFTADTLTAGGSVTLPEEAAHHMRVARIVVGERVALRDGAGTVAEGTLVKISRSSALVDVIETREAAAPAPIHLLAPVADRERMLWLAEKAAELGIATWRPVMWRRSRSVTPRGDGPTFQRKVRARMVSALLQSGGAWLPDVFPEASVERAVSAAPAGMRILLARDGEPIAAIEMRAPITIALGPEGGIEDVERDALIAGGFIPVRLAESTLRFETAGIAAIAVVVAQLSHTRSSVGQA